MNAFPPAAATAQHQVRTPPDKTLDTASAEVVLWRSAQIRAGHGPRARAATRALAEDFNERNEGIATALSFEDAFGTRGRLHWLIHLRTLGDYTALTQRGADRGSGVFGRDAGEDDGWEELFEAGSVRETVLLPHRWGIFGTATEAMAQQETTRQDLNPVETVDGRARFQLLPAARQSSLPLESLLTSASSGLLMHRTAQVHYAYRAEARVLVRTLAETYNLNAKGRTTVLLFEEAFGQMDRLHMFIHMADIEAYQELMALDASPDPSAPRASYIQEWISPERGGGTWDKIVIQDSTRDGLLVPRTFG
ncbi:DUF6039 family protein [Streptomyces sp. NPDC059096]|uniref:DUF6039 family protein n=1 Tax=unclassified Streptomyces TaxID=2593676 RepID=UPI00369D1006